MDGKRRVGRGEGAEPVQEKNWRKGKKKVKGTKKSNNEN